VVACGISAVFGSPFGLGIGEVGSSVLVVLYLTRIIFGTSAEYKIVLSPKKKHNPNPCQRVTAQACDFSRQSPINEWFFTSRNPHSHNPDIFLPNQQDFSLRWK
jgi:hypothetical protein